MFLHITHRSWLYLCGDDFSFQLFGLVVRDERVDEFVNVAFHEEVELMEGQTNAVIGDAVIFEVVSANFFGAVATADHRATFRS